MLTAYPTLDLRAIAYKVIVAPEAEAKSASVIEIVTSLKDAFRIGKVLSVGAVAKEKVPELEPGVRVLYAQSVACTTAVEGRHIVHHDHVIAVIGEGTTLGDLDPKTYARPGVHAHAAHE